MSALLPPVAVLGPAIEHRESLVASLSDQCAAVHCIDDSFTFLRMHRHSGPIPLMRRLDAVRGTRDPGYLDYLAQQLDQSAAEFVIAYWGTLPLADVIALRRMRPKLRIVLWLLCYPLSLRTAGILKQHWLLRLASSSLDAVVCPGPQMAERLRQGTVPSAMPMAVVRPCWPASYHARQQRALEKDAPNLVYVGRADLSGASVHSADDQRATLRQMLDAGIAVSHGLSKEMNDGHPLRHMFKPVPVPQLTERMSGHDASLMAYNLQACERTDRFAFTVPDRLISSVAAGVPVAIPDQHYAASRSYLEDYPAVIPFTSAQDLRRRLDDRESVAALRAAAWAARSGYTAEAQGPALAALLRTL